MHSCLIKFDSSKGRKVIKITQLSYSKQCLSSKAINESLGYPFPYLNLIVTFRDMRGQTKVLSVFALGGKAFAMSSTHLQSISFRTF